MQALFSCQNNIFNLTDIDVAFLIVSRIKKKGTRLLGLKGLSGVGKTTMLLQYLKTDCPQQAKESQTFCS
jgi:hypothetical protein